MYIVLIGAPGAGKGTQATALQDGSGLAHVATGEMFRDAMAKRTLRGLQAKAYVDRGELVPDDVTLGMVMERLGQNDCKGGAVLDGFPRTLPQAEALDRAFGEQSRRLDLALYLSVPGDELLRRLSGRWLCRDCQASYHEVFEPPTQAGICERCGGALYQRDDDKPDTARRRLAVYFEQTTPVIDYYRKQGILEEIDGSRDVGTVRDAIGQALRRHGARF